MYEIIHINLKTYNKILKISIRAAKQQFLASTFAKYNSDIRNTWKTINEIISRNGNKKSFPTLININNTEITNKLDIANKFNAFFTNIGINLANNITYTGQKNFEHYLKKTQNYRFELSNTDEQTILKTIETLPTKNSSGFDGISSKLFKKLAPTIIKPLTLLLTQVFNTGIFPDKLKVAKVIPVFKKGNPTIINNYRPISLLPVVSKVMEKILANQLSSYFESKKLFVNNQYGFRDGHSTEYAALELVDRIITKMDNNEVPISIFLDLSKAFDTLNHKILLNKLKYYGIEGVPLQLFKSYLTNRT